MTKVKELTAGDKVELAGHSAIFVTEGPHPLYPKLRLVVWRVDGREWSFDALSAEQEVGEVVQGETAETRNKRLRQILMGI